MTLKFSTGSYWQWFGAAFFLLGPFGLFPIGLYLFSDFDYGWIFGGVGLLLGCGLLYDIFRRIALSEYLYIDDVEIKLHFKDVTRNLLWSDVEALVEWRGGDVTSFVVKTVGGERLLIPDHYWLKDFVVAAQRKYGFTVRSSSAWHLNKL